ncbi:putative serine protease K12H4.7 isoform X1 [Maniola jurtina]|uniref:putative serine protease K12H4.7 isoform X1 n=1 Tax=Maniola jurtina TaxID=191418 RepID=UPI001E68604A|nr:putative serine protease K12H4.7 isoform X1 [Maniola jurtina]
MFSSFHTSADTFLLSLNSSGFQIIVCSLSVLLSLFASIWAEPRFIEPPLRIDFDLPVEFRSLTTSDVKTAWIDMPINHFDPQNRDTYKMRYMYNEEFFGGDGKPVFILVGGEWDIVPGWLRAGNMFLMAQENQGHQIYTEHRYYGQSLPYKNFTTENLRFLNVDQALADLAYFIKEVKQTPRFANSKVVLYGGSYAANMVLWFKQRYPHLVVGGVASSGPTKGQVDFTGYLEVVHQAFLSEGGPGCIATIRQGIAETIAAMQTATGRQNLEKVYRLCSPLNYDSAFDLGYFSGLISWTFSTSVQQARPATLTRICNNFANNVYGTTAMEQIGGYIAATRNLGSGCWNIDYKSYVEMYRTQNTNSRAWYYQTCTEYGYYQTAPRTGTAFDQLTWLSVPFYVDVCKQAYHHKFDEAFVYDAVERVNLIFGGLTPDVNSTINIHGAIDPWHALGVHDRDLKEGSPTITVPRASHCFDMQGWLESNTIRMTNAQQFARRMVARWLSN